MSFTIGVNSLPNDSTEEKRVNQLQKLYSLRWECVPTYTFNYMISWFKERFRNDFIIVILGVCFWKALQLRKVYPGFNFTHDWSRETISYDVTNKRNCLVLPTVQTCHETTKAEHSRPQHHTDWFKQWWFILDSSQSPTSITTSAISTFIYCAVVVRLLQTTDTDIGITSSHGTQLICLPYLWQPMFTRHAVFHGLSHLGRYWARWWKYFCS